MAREQAHTAPAEEVRDAAVLPPQGRGEFDQVTTPRTKWAPSPDHYPILKSAGGHLRPENVRLAHIYCNKRGKGVLPAHGTNRWTAAMVRKAYVS